MISDAQAGYGKLFDEALFDKMYADFESWRINDFIKQMNTVKHKGRVLDFVRGLRLSAHLIYIVRDLLSHTDLEASWGHLLDQNGVFCSCECDVIIHHKGYHARWNGTDNPIMDFRFIEQQKAVAVISCKSRLKSRSQIDKKYCESMRPFVQKVWLFAECCGPRNADSIRAEALRLGYEKFWHLYTYGEKSGATEPNRIGWREFAEEVRKLSSVMP